MFDCLHMFPLTKNQNDSVCLGQMVDDQSNIHMFLSGIIDRTVCCQAIKKKKTTRKLVSQMLHGAGTFTNICPCPKSPSFVGFDIPAPWFASGYSFFQ